MSTKKVGIKTLGWFNEEGLPEAIMSSSLPDQDAVIKAFIGVKVEVREVNGNSIRLVAIQEDKPASENVPLQSMDQKELLVVAAKLGVTGVDGRTSKPNIIAAIRKNANATTDD